MNEPSNKPEIKQPETPDQIGLQINALTKIEGHLKSIRSMLQFFVLLAILTILVQACSVLGLL